MAANDQAIYEEIENLVCFCKKHKNIYVLWNDEVSRKIGKFLFDSGLAFNGYLAGVDDYKRLLESTEDYGVVVYHRPFGGEYITDLFVKKDRAFLISEYNTRCILTKTKVRDAENFYLEVNLADHCNLNCQCCDHFSPLASPHFLNVEQYEKDLKRLSSLLGNKRLAIMKLQGGEPLLNKNINKIIEITRYYLPLTHIWLYTDGLLLKSWENNINGNLWKTIKDNDIMIMMTRYPINLKMEPILELVKKYGVSFTSNSNAGDFKYEGEKWSVCHPFDFRGTQPIWKYVSCYQFNEVPVLRDGKIYPCPQIAYIEYFNKFFNKNLMVNSKDYIDIYKASSLEEILEFLSSPYDFCRYCDVKNRYSLPWKQSERNISEYSISSKAKVLNAMIEKCNCKEQISHNIQNTNAFSKCLKQLISKIREV